MPILADIFNECRSTYGVKRYTYAVKARNLPFPVGCNRIRKLMKSLGFHCNTLKKFRPRSKDKIATLSGSCESDFSAKNLFFSTRRSPLP